jgi:ribosomal protein L29
MVKDIDKKSIDELEKLQGEMEVKLRDFRFGIAGSKSRNVKEGFNLKKDIARVKTQLKQLSADKK